MMEPCGLRWSHGWAGSSANKRNSETRNASPSASTCPSHYHQGRRYLLNVIYHDAPPQVVVRNKTILDLHVRDGSDTEQRGRVLRAWYRTQLRQAATPLFAKWEAAIGEQANEWGIKQMKTKWGACNIEARRIWLNLELAKKPVQCLEYIVVHELVHLIERNHNERFQAQMDRFLPQWRLNRADLNREPLGHEAWGY